jgi:hypothetical protein
LKKERRAARLAAASVARQARGRTATSMARRTLATSATQADRGSRALPDHLVAVVVAMMVLSGLGALLILGLGFVPSAPVPRSRLSAVLEEHHSHLTLLGGIVLLSGAISLALTLLAK